LRTDAAGRFELSNANGDVLKIEAVEKSGYEPEPKALRGFGFNNAQRHTPDQNNPIVVRMWKSDLKTHLVSGDKRCSLIPDGRVYTLDLLRGALSEGTGVEGDLRVAIRRTENAAWGQHFAWSLELHPVQGGLLEEHDSTSAMFRAPGTGYSNVFRMEVLASAPTWSDYTGKKRFFLNTRGGQHFARIEIDAYAFYLQDKQARLNISYTLNPSGERLLR
jgi:hypothetical protein